MTTESQPTLTILLGLRSDGGGSVIDESGEALRALRSHVGEGLPPGVWDAVRDGIGAAVAAACDVPLTTIFAEAWKKYEPLREYCDPERHPDEESTTTELATHTVSSVQHPTVEFIVGEKSLFSLELDAEVEIELDGAVLTIRAGRFMELATGRSLAKASLTYKGATLAERKLGEYTLPGRISFGEGIPICPGRHRPVAPRVPEGPGGPTHDAPPGHPTW